jgi:hypothetical protein
MEVEETESEARLELLEEFERRKKVKISFCISTELLYFVLSET